MARYFGFRSAASDFAREALGGSFDIRPPTSLGELEPMRPARTPTYGFPGGSELPVPRDRFSRTIDLGPGDYYWGQAERNAVAKMQWYKNIASLKQLNDVGTSLATVGFGVAEWVAAEFLGAWSQPVGTGRPLNIPAGWTNNVHCTTPGPSRWWSAHSGTCQANNYTPAQENKFFVSTGVGYWFTTTPSDHLAVGPQTFAKCDEWMHPWQVSTPDKPYRTALRGAGVQAAPFAQGVPVRQRFAFPQMRRVQLDWAPYRHAAVSISSSVPPNGPVKVQHGYHDQLPPPRGTRERKPGGVGKGGLIGDAYGALTELNDLMDCMKRSINNKSQRVGKSRAFRKFAPKPRGENPYEEFRYIVNNAERMDPMAFVKCFAAKELGDQAIGRLNRAASRAAADSGYWPFPRGVGISGFARHALSHSGSLRMR